MHKILEIPNSCHNDAMARLYNLESTNAEINPSLNSQCEIRFKNI